MSEDLDQLDLPDYEEPAEDGLFILVRRRPTYSTAYWSERKRWDERRSAARVFAKRSAAKTARTHAAWSSRINIDQIAVEEAA